MRTRGWEVVFLNKVPRETCWGRMFQAEETATTRPLKQDCARCVQGTARKGVSKLES